jgi:hypothetical protein
VVTDYHGAGVALVQFFEQLSQGSLLFSRSRVGGLTSDVEPALVADANRVAVVVQAVGADLLFRTAWLYLSVTTDHVVVADAEVEASLAVPRINLCRGTGLVGPYYTAMNNNQCNYTHILFLF